MYGVRKPRLEGFTDLDMSGDVDSSRSTSRYVMTYAVGVLSWQSWLQKSVALSTTKAKYMAAVEAGKELIWMRNFLSELGMKQREFLLHCDIQSAIHLAKKVTYHSWTKNIQRRYHWLQENVEKEEFTLVKIHTDDNGFDMMNKNLPMDRLRVCQQRKGITDPSPLEWSGRLLGICPTSGKEPTGYDKGATDWSDESQRRGVDSERVDMESWSRSKTWSASRAD